MNTSYVQAMSDLHTKAKRAEDDIEAITQHGSSSSDLSLRDGPGIQESSGFVGFVTMDNIQNGSTSRGEPSLSRQTNVGS